MRLGYTRAWFDIDRVVYAGALGRKDIGELRAEEIWEFVKDIRRDELAYLVL